MVYAADQHPCKDCGKPIKCKSKTRCSACGKKRTRENNPEIYKARMARKRQRKSEHELCIRCNKNKKHSKLYCGDCLKLMQYEIKIERQNLRIEVLQHYGDKCDCCGESHIEFLSIDHIEGGGNAHRKEIKASGINLYRWLKNNKYPSGFRILCMSCNWAISIYGEEHIRKILELT